MEVKAKQSLYRPLGLQEVEAPRISRPTANEDTTSTYFY
jgi:hypothetical protein